MPAATTHAEFAKDVMNILDDTSVISKHLHMFLLGSQGPDMLFFHKAGILPGSIARIGSKMHHSDPYEIIRSMQEYAEYTDSDPLRAYIKGFMCHYALDSVEHPLINYSSKYRGNEEESFIINHYRIEAYIDVLILNRHGKGINDYSVHEEVRITRTEAVNLAFMYKQMVLDLYKQFIPFTDFRDAAMDTGNFLSLLKPTSKVKFIAANAIENITGNNHFVSGLMLYNDMSEQDVLNNGHQEWHNIEYPQMTASDSFFERYETALAKAKHLIESPLDKKDYLLDFEGNPV